MLFRFFMQLPKIKIIQLCVTYSKMAFLNICLRLAQWMKILNSESVQLQLSIRQGLGNIRIINRGTEQY